MGRAEELLERIREHRTTEIEDMIKNQVVEELFLDYKCAATSLPSNKLHEDDRKNLAKAICGFGNSEGGLIVWGVDCKQGSSGDVPSWPPKKITHVKVFKTLLDSAVGGLTLPAHQRVENVEITYPLSSDGFVVTHVPMALNVPLQTLFPKHEFYIRAGSTFMPTPRAVLAGLFGRGPQAEFIIQIHKLSFERGASKAQVRLKFLVQCSNEGRGVARELFFNIEARLDKRAKIQLSTFPDILDTWTDPPSTGSYKATLICKPFNFPPGARKYFFEFSVVMEGKPSHDVMVSVSCGASNAVGSAKEFTLPGNILFEVYSHYLANYPDHLAKQAADKHYEPMILNCIA
jgi:hypothetical protein